MPVLTAHITDVAIHTGIGIHDHEKNRKQKLSVSCEIGFIPERWPAVSISDCYNYDALYHYITVTVASGPHIDLIETLLHNIAKFIFEDPRVSTVQIRLSKPDILPRAGGVGVAFGPCPREVWERTK